MSQENVEIVRAVYDPEDAAGVLRDDDLWAAWVERVGHTSTRTLRATSLMGSGSMGEATPSRV